MTEGIRGAIARNVAMMRRMRNVGVDELSERSGLPASAIRAIEAGTRAIDLETLAQIALHLDTTPGRLVDGPVTARMIDLAGIDDADAAALERLAASARSKGN